MEKTGQTVKLVYDFNTASNLEIFIPTLNRFHRVTSREFRSFNGERKINGKPYNGPIYLYNTNKRANKSLHIKHKLVGYKWISKKRPGEDLD